MDKEKQDILTMCILAAALISVLLTAYYGAVIKPGLDERDRELPKIEIKAETWTPELLQAYNNSHPLEYLEHHPFSGITINNEFVSVKKIVIIVIPEYVESRASFATHTDIYTYENEGVVFGNRTESTTTESDMAYVFTNMSVSNALYDRYKLFYNPALGPDGMKVRMINLTSATFPADSTLRELQYNDNRGVIGVTDTTTTEGVAVHKVGIHSTDENITINPDDVSFYLTSPEIYENA